MKLTWIGESHTNGNADEDVEMRKKRISINSPLSNSLLTGRGLSADGHLGNI